MNLRLCRPNKDYYNYFERSILGYKKRDFCNHEPIISRELWNKVLEVNASVSRGKCTTERVTHALSGLCYCDECGAKMKMQKTPENKSPYSYRCGMHDRYGKAYCSSHNISTIPVDFLQTWVYVKNNRSMLATAVFHLFLNVMQEKINISPETKCIETFVMLAAAVIIVYKNTDIFFEKEHIGSLLEIQYRNDDHEKHEKNERKEKQ